jgi:hypothetical protein
VLLRRNALLLILITLLTLLTLLLLNYYSYCYLIILQRQINHNRGQVRTRSY